MLRPAIPRARSAVARPAAGGAPGPMTTVFVPQAGLLPARLSQAVLMQACLRAAGNAFRRALHAALDAAPCRRSGPRRLWIEGRGPPRPLIREGQNPST